MALGVFSNGTEPSRRDHEAEIERLHAKIGEFTLERVPKATCSSNFFSKGLNR